MEQGITDALRHAAANFRRVLPQHGLFPALTTLLETLRLYQRTAIIAVVDVDVETTDQAAMEIEQRVRMLVSAAALLLPEPLTSSFVTYNLADDCVIVIAEQKSRCKVAAFYFSAYSIKGQCDADAAKLIGRRLFKMLYGETEVASLN